MRLERKEAKPHRSVRSTNPDLYPFEVVLSIVFLIIF